MRYKIKITTYANGRQEFKPYVKAFIGWKGLDYEGEADYTYSYRSGTRGNALQCIDKHVAGNKKKSTIYFEYFNK